MTNFFALFGVLFFVSLYFENVQHLDAVQAGIRLLPANRGLGRSRPASSVPGPDPITVRAGCSCTVALAHACSTSSVRKTPRSREPGPGSGGNRAGHLHGGGGLDRGHHRQRPRGRSRAGRGPAGHRRPAGRGPRPGPSSGPSSQRGFGAVLPSKLAEFGLPSSLRVPTSMVDQGVVPPPGDVPGRDRGGQRGLPVRSASGPGRRRRGHLRRCLLRAVHQGQPDRRWGRRRRRGADRPIMVHFDGPPSGSAPAGRGAGRHRKGWSRAGTPLHWRLMAYEARGVVARPRIGHDDGLDRHRCPFRPGDHPSRFVCHEPPM